jgi:hypothetical protein
MQNLIRRTLHPSGRELIFESKFHKYSMTDLGLFRSVSQVLDSQFPFDQDRLSQLVAQKTGRTVAQVLEEWKLAAQLGTNTHAYIESHLSHRRHLPQSDWEKDKVQLPAMPVLQGNETAYFKGADILVQDILEQYEVVALETMVCHPEAAVAGTIDFIGRNRKTGRIVVADWKTSSASTRFQFGIFDEPTPGLDSKFLAAGSSPLCGVPLLSHLANTKLNRYALQVLIYGYILQSQGYANLFKEPAMDEPLEYLLGIVAPQDELAPGSSEGTPSASNSSRGGAYTVAPTYHYLQPVPFLNPGDVCRTGEGLQPNGLLEMLLRGRTAR